jgi:putative PIN family toxin of toxin-antitoxin system
VRLVLDTNTALSGLLWPGGNPGQLVDAAQAGQVELFTSVALLSELQSVLARGKFARQLQTRKVAARDLFDGYATLARVVTPAPIAPTIRRDPDDDHVLACALAAQADLLVTGDRDLLDIGEYQQIQIVTATTALKRLAQDAAGTARDDG